MKIEGAERDAVFEIAGAMGIHLVEQKAKNEGELKVLVRPRAGSNTLRCISKAGAAKNSLCLHGWYAFMARVFARFPDAVLRTYENVWDYPLFQGGARGWTENQMRERERYDTCMCTPEEVAEAMLSPDELRVRPWYTMPLTEQTSEAKARIIQTRVPIEALCPNPVNERGGDADTRRRRAKVR
jgi:hypothetical protein